MLGLAGAMAGLAFPGATTTATFESYVEDVLVPELRPGDVVIWDNLKPHQSEEAIEAVEAAGADVVPLPPYSPDRTPIEEMFSKVKGAMRSAAGRTKEAVYAAFASALARRDPQRYRRMVPGPSGVRYATVRRSKKCRNRTSPSTMTQITAPTNSPGLFLSRGFLLTLEFRRVAPLRHSRSSWQDQSRLSLDVFQVSHDDRFFVRQLRQDDLRLTTEWPARRASASNAAIFS